MDKTQINVEVDDCLQEADGMQKDAERLFLKRVEEDTGLYDALVRPLLERAVSELVRERIRHYRKQVKQGFAHPPQQRSGRQPSRGPGSTSSVQGLRDMGQREAKRLLDFALPGGKLLRAAVWSEAERTRSMYEKHARGNAIEAAWFKAICAKLPKDDSKCVEQIFTEQALRRMRTRAVRAV